MSPAAFAMLMASAKQQFEVAFKTEDMDVIQSVLEDIKRLHRAYYGYDAFCGSDSVSIPRSQRAIS